MTTNTAVVSGFFKDEEEQAVLHRQKAPKAIEVIVGRTYGEGASLSAEVLMRHRFQVRDHVFSPEDQCTGHQDLLKRFQPLCVAGVSVVVRPCYNDTYTEGRYSYREWRSLNGEAWREIVFHN